MPSEGKYFNATPKINYTVSDISRNHGGALADKLAVALNIDLVPTKNLPFSGFVPANTAGAPSHLTETFDPPLPP